MKRIVLFLGAATSLWLAEARAEVPSCLLNGSDFANCALIFERVHQNSNQVNALGESYVLGAFQRFVKGVAFAELQGSFCPTQPFSGNQLYAIVAQYVRVHPKTWGEEPFVLVKTDLGLLSRAKSKGNNRTHAARGTYRGNK